MSHSHACIQHLIRQAELRHMKRKRLGELPQWLTAFIDTVADLFDPQEPVGRVGFDCQPVDGAWIVSVFLGRVETVGGSRDGEIRALGFQFDLLRLMGHFTTIEHMSWDVDGTSDEAAVVAVDGCVDSYRLQLRVLAAPPDMAGPALREYSDGRIEPT